MTSENDKQINAHDWTPSQCTENVSKEHKVMEAEVTQ